MRPLFALILPLWLAGLVSAESRVIAVSLDKVIHPITVEMLTHAIEQAKRERADILLIRINTPGGLLEATREAVQKIVASPVPVVTFVTPSGGRAASAGFFLLESGDVAAMADGTNAGAASAVLLSGQQVDPVLRKKVDNDAAALLRSLAAKHGRAADRRPLHFGHARGAFILSRDADRHGDRTGGGRVRCHRRATRHDAARGTGVGSAT